MIHAHAVAVRNIKDAVESNRIPPIMALVYGEIH